MRLADEAPAAFIDFPEDPETRMILRTHFVIAVEDLARTCAFYRDALGFAAREIGDPGWRMLERDGCRIMAGECRGAPQASETGNHSYFAYLVVDDVDAEFARVHASGADLLKRVRDEPWGMREFGLRTCDGHRIMVGQEIGPRGGAGKG